MRTERGVVDTSQLKSIGGIEIECLEPDGCVIISGSVESKRLKSCSCVSAARCVAVEGTKPSRHIMVTRSVVIKGLRTISRAQAAGSVAKKRLVPGRGILVASSVVKERLVTKGSIPNASGEAEQSIRPLGRVGTGIASVRWWSDSAGVRQKLKADEGKYN